MLDCLGLHILHVCCQGVVTVKARCRGLKWVGKGIMPEQCKNSALAGRLSQQAEQCATDLLNME